MNITVYGSDENILAHKDVFDFIEAKNKDLDVHSFNNATIYPISQHVNALQIITRFGGVTDENGSFIQESGLYRKYRANQAPTQIVGDINPLEACREAKKSHETVVFLGVFYTHWGHFLLESLARFHFFLKAEHKKYKAVYIAEEKLGDAYTKILDLFGFESIERIEYPTQFETVIIPEPSYRIYDFMHSAHLEVCNRIASKIDPVPMDKIYFTREKFQRNNFLMGEAPFEALFTANGFKVFAPEKLNVVMQIALIKGAKTVAGVCGSALHTLLFSNNKNQECIHLNRFKQVAGNQVNIAKHKEIHTHFVETQLDIFPSNMGFGPFLLGPTEYFMAFCEQNNLKFDYAYFRNSFHLDLQKYCLEWFLIYNDKDRFQLIKNNTKIDVAKLPVLVGGMIEKIVMP